MTDELKSNMNKENVGYLTVVYGFLNCLLSQPEDLKVRLTIRFELQGKYFQQKKLNKII